MKIAIIGSGISGLSVAHQLRGQADLTLYEAGDYFGGHTHTVDVTLPMPPVPLSPTAWTRLSGVQRAHLPEPDPFAGRAGRRDGPIGHVVPLQVPGALGGSGGGRALEWSGTSLSTVFAHGPTCSTPAFWAVARPAAFQQAVHPHRRGQGRCGVDATLGDFLRENRFGDAFRDWYFCPCWLYLELPHDQMLKFPVATMIRFCHNHGLIPGQQSPQWWTVAGGARTKSTRSSQA